LNNKNKLLAWGQILSVLGVIKRVSEKNTHLQGLLMAFGAVGIFLDIKKYFRNFLPLLMMLFIGSFFSIIHHQVNKAFLFRLIQLCLMYGVTNFYLQNASSKQFKKVLFTIELLSFILLLGELFFIPSIYGASRLLPIILRRALIIGEPNFSAFLLFGCFMLRMYYRDFRNAFFLFALIFIFSGSVSSFSIILLFLVLYGLMRIEFKFLNKILMVVFVLLILYPVLAFMVPKIVDDKTFLQLTRISSHRFYIHYLYSQIGFSHPFGVGFLNSLESYKELFAGYSPFLLHIGIDHPEINEQHSSFMLIFSEFGIIGYLFFTLFLTKIFFYLNQKKEVLLQIIFLCLLLNANTINTQYELAFYLVLSFIFFHSDFKIQKFSDWIDFKRAI
jgi:hypothetical protein